ncbi:hypothetical protein BT69DRAFT_1285712 [Atractiella rhizophila]|nr:hypothetical protein BT69DRAFT_1285712 [Atractiella rhizophila]
MNRIREEYQRLLYAIRYSKHFALSTYIRLKHTYKNEKHCFWEHFWYLFWPMPWFHSIPAPYPPLQLHQDGIKLIEPRILMIERSRHIPLWKVRDTPLAALYRLYEYSCSHAISFVHEVTYIWYRFDWPIFDFPDPKDPDPVRYAILACLVESMVYAFNWRIEEHGFRREKHEILYFGRNPLPLTLERVPEWCRKVPPSPIEVDIHREPCSETRRGAKMLKRKNIIHEGFAAMFFV